MELELVVVDNVVDSCKKCPLLWALDGAIEAAEDEVVAETGGYLTQFRKSIAGADRTPDGRGGAADGRDGRDEVKPPNSSRFSRRHRVFLRFATNLDQSHSEAAIPTKFFLSLLDTKKAAKHFQPLAFS